MELSTIIPNINDINWSVKGNFLMYKKYSNIPTAYIDDTGVIFIFLDFRIVKQVSKLVSHVSKMGLEFYFDSPEFSNPSADASEYNKKVLIHYLYSYADKNIFSEFKKIEFDIVKNMVKFCDKNDCHDLLKPCYDEIKKIVLRTTTDYYSNREVNDYPDEIREEFQNLYRDIQISKII